MAILMTDNNKDSDMVFFGKLLTVLFALGGGLVWALETSSSIAALEVTVVERKDDITEIKEGIIRIENTLKEK